MLRICSAALALMLAPFILTLPVLAQAVSDTTVTVPYGDWIANSTGFIGWFLALVIAWAMRQLPASIVGVIKTAQVEQLLQRAIDYAINAVAGATKDKVLDANVGNAVIAEALRYVVSFGPKWIIGFLGGEAGIKARIIARLELAPTVSVAVSSSSTLIQQAPRV